MLSRLIVAILIFCASARADEELQIASRLVVAPGKIAITPAGRQFVSLHPFYSPKNRVVEITKDGTLKPFPNAAYNNPDSNPLGVALDSVLGLQSDPNGVVWMLDNGMRGHTLAKLLAWDTRTDKLARVIFLPPPATVADSFVSDLAIDPVHNVIFIADPAGGADAAIIVVDIPTGLARRVLQGHVSVAPEDVDLVIGERIVEMKKADGTKAKLRVGVSPIALDANCDWLYFGPMSGTSMYRAPAAALADPRIARDLMPEQVERYCDKPVCDGIAIDKSGNIYVSDIGASAVGVITTQHTYRKLAGDPQLAWPDALAIGPDGWLYVAANQLQLSPQFNGGASLAEPPFLIFKMKPLAPDAITTATPKKSRAKKRASTQPPPQP